MTKYEELQAQHQALLEQRQGGRDIPALVEAVKAYVKQVRDEAEAVPSPRDRDQLRANLRFWATFLYDRTGVYPDTTLRPPLPSVLEAGSTGAAPPPPPALEVGSARPMAQMQAPKKGLPISRLAILGIGAGAVLLVVIIIGILLTGTFRARPQAAYQTSMPAPNQELTAETVAGETSPVNLTPTQIQQATDTPGPAVFTNTPEMMETQMGAAPATSTVVLSLATETVAAAFPTETVTALPTPTLSQPEAGGGGDFIPVTGGGGVEFVPLDTRPVLSARVSVSSNPSNCLVEEIQVAFDLGPTESVTQVVPVSERELRVDIRQIGSPPGAAAPLLRRDQNNFFISLENAVGEPTYLVHVEHPRLTADDVILQMGRDCTDNLVKVTYNWSQGPSFVSVEPPRSPTLELGWELVTWGPVPRLDPADPETAWVAVLNLTAGNRSGEVVYFKFSNYEGFQPLAGNQVLLEGNSPCEPAVLLVGVAFAGQSTAREIRLISPYCVER